MSQLSEIYLTTKNTSRASWHKLLSALARLLGPLATWEIQVIFDRHYLHYLITTKLPLPSSFSGLPEFIIKPLQATPAYFSNPINIKFGRPFYATAPDSAADWRNFFAAHRREPLRQIQLHFRSVGTRAPIVSAHIYTDTRCHILLGVNPATILAVDFASNYHLSYAKAPKYLDTSKIAPLLTRSSANALLLVDTFPYEPYDHHDPHEPHKLYDPHETPKFSRAHKPRIQPCPHQSSPSYLPITSINVAQHSIIFGATGSGKSKFISSLAQTVITHQAAPQPHLIILDPHAALAGDLGGLGPVISFADASRSVDLFQSSPDTAVTAAEMLLATFKPSLSDTYNPKLERVLRHALLLLLSVSEFNFSNLRRLLTDTTYRNSLLRRIDTMSPSTSSLAPARLFATSSFFHTEFNELRSRSYTDAIAPIIALTDEITTIPGLSQLASGAPQPTNHVATSIPSLTDLINSHRLTLFSLNRTELGEGPVKILASLITEQLFVLAEQHAFTHPLIFIIDEVAVLDNPLLPRLLAEARKFGISLYLAGQYFGSLSSSLQQSIFANVANFYLFRLSRDDASLMSSHISLKIPLDDTPEQKIKFLSEQPDRHVVVRASIGGKLLPGFAARTLDFTPVPAPIATATRPSAPAQLQPHTAFYFTSISAPSPVTILTRIQPVFCRPIATNHHPITAMRGPIKKEPHAI